MMNPGRSALASWVALAAGLLAVASLVWFVGPLLALGDWRPLEGVAARAALIALLLLLPALAGLWRLLRDWYRARRALRQPDALDTVVDLALLRLRARPAGPAGGWRALWAQLRQRSLPDPLAALPWVLVIGLPGADKRRALAAAGYALPLHHKAEPPCTWCITPQAVLIDVADDLLTGRQAAWLRLLQRLRQARPLQPVSAVLLLLPAGGRAGQVLADLAPQVAMVQARLAELYRIAGLVPPLHLAITGCERLDGFPTAALDQRLHAAARGLGLSATAPGPVALLGRDAAALRRFIDTQVLARPAQPLYAAGWLLRRRRLVRAGYAATILVAGGLTAGWLNSRALNLDLIERQQARLAAVRPVLAAAQPALATNNLPALLDALDQVSAGLTPAQAEAEAADWRAGLGLFQGDKLQAFAETAHARLVRDSLVPVVLRWQEAQLRAQLGAPTRAGGEVYAALQLYLGLLDRVPFDQGEVAALAKGFGTGPAPLSNRQVSTLQGLLADLHQADGTAGTAADETLVAQARQWLASQPTPALLNDLLQRRHSLSGQAPLGVAALVGDADAPLFRRASGRPLDDGVPMLYTLQGLDQFVKNTLNDSMLDQVRQVLGQPVERRDLVAVNRSTTVEALGLYLQDYASTWARLLFDLRLQPPTDTAAAERLAARLVAADSPLARLLREAATQTAPGARLAALAGGTAPMAVDQQFAALARLVTGQPPPLDATLALMAERLRQPAAPAASVAALRAEAAKLPEPLSGMLADLAGGTQAAPAPAAPVAPDASAMAGYLALQRQCQSSAANRYPLVAAAKSEMSLRDFGALFGAGTGFDAYFQRWLAPWVDTSGVTWRWKPGSAGQTPVPPAALDSFQRAASLRDTFFRAGGAQPSLSVGLGIGNLDAGTTAAELRRNGTPTALRPGQGPVTIAWPGQPALQRLSLGDAGAKQPDLAFSGDWTLPRLLDALTLQPTRAPGRYAARLTLAGRPTELSVTLTSAPGLVKTDLRQFRCPPPAVDLAAPRAAKAAK